MHKNFPIYTMKSLLHFPALNLNALTPSETGSVLDERIQQILCSWQESLIC